MKDTNQVFSSTSFGPGLALRDRKDQKTLL